MRIERLATTYTVQETYKALGLSRSRFYSSGVAEFLHYYQEGDKRRAYLRYDVANFQHWLMIRDGMIALGHWKPQSRKNGSTLPPEDTVEAKRNMFEAWIADDIYGTECPQCDGKAVQGEMGGAVWCKDCGIID